VRPVSAPPPALRTGVAALALSAPRLGAAIAFGAAALGSAVALTAVSAWLISRAAQHPSITAVALAVVAVRALGISRGVFRYLERLISHDVALRGTVRLREQLYTRLAATDAGVVAALRRGDLMARVGPDVDLVGDVVVRGLLPFAVALVVCSAGVGLIAVVLPAAGAILFGCLLVAAAGAPWLAATAAARAHRVADETNGELTALAHELLDHATELTVAGKVEQRLAKAAGMEAVRSRALDAAARPAAWAAAVSSAATGAAVVGCLVVGAVAVHDNVISPVMLAVVTLTPLAMVEVVASLPAAAAALVRGSLAARRLAPLLLAAPAATRSGDGARVPAGSMSPSDVGLSARGLTCSWPGLAPAVSRVDLDLVPGQVLAITGPNGGGKSTLLLTLAGLLAPAAGHVWIDGIPLAQVAPHTLRRTVTLTSQDAHVFTTTLRDNLLVARGDATDKELTAALRAAGLSDWAAGLHGGLDTLIDPGSVSGGERRRILFARAMLVGSRVLLLDEPAEHLDAEAADAVMDELGAHARACGVAVAVVTHHLNPLGHADRWLVVAAGRAELQPAPARRRRDTAAQSLAG